MRGVDQMHIKCVIFHPPFSGLSLVLHSLLQLHSLKRRAVPPFLLLLLLILFLFFCDGDVGASVVFIAVFVAAADEFLSVVVLIFIIMLSLGVIQPADHQHYKPDQKIQQWGSELCPYQILRCAVRTNTKVFCHV